MVQHAGHQLPALPPVDSFWDALPEIFAWLSGSPATTTPVSYKVNAGETVIREPTLRLRLDRRIQSHLEIIRFAAANRLCVEISHVDKDGSQTTDLIEPYSLRHTKAKEIVLHTWTIERDTHRSFRIERITDARITDRVFEPRYTIELTPTGPV